MKIKYTFIAETPLFTGSDEKSGTVRTLRREKRRLKKSIKIDSSFSNENKRTSALMDIIYNVYSEIDVKLKKGNYGFYDAYSNKVKASTFVKTKKQFLTRLLEGCGIANVSGESGKQIREALDLFTDFELLETIRSEHSYLMILLREYVAFYRDKNKVAKAGITGPGLFDSLYKEPSSPAIEKIKIEKNFEKIPYFGGNSIRGYLRRIAMYDFCKLNEITSINKDTYHQLFTGGNITDSTEFEDISKRETFIKNCPMIGLFGSAIGNMTIEGEMLVQGARLKCIENDTGDISFWEQTELNFGTRLDSSKKEKNINIIEGKKETRTSQMIYQFENFVTGSEFDSSFILKSDNELIVSAFWRMIKLWKEFPIIGGNSARDAGIIDINIDIPDNADKLYLDYLDKNNINIKDYFNV